MAQDTRPYHTKRFRNSNYDQLRFPGPRPGEPAADFTVYDFDGNEIKLADFRGKWIVLETGSVTCGMYVHNIPHINALKKDYPDVEFLVIYVREAHPGERIPQHESFDTKVEAAKLLKPKYGEERRVLVDSLDGDMHCAYSLHMPNIVYVINPEGIVTYRCDWAHEEGVREALDNRDRLHTVEHAHTDMLLGRSRWQAIKAMWNGGFIALWDFLKAYPQFGKLHTEVDEFFEEHGRLKQ